MGRSKFLKKDFSTLKDLFQAIGHPECRILEDAVRSRLIDSLVRWYADNCGPLDTPDVLRKGWKGFEDMNDLELIDDWLKTTCIECSDDIRCAIALKLKLFNDIYQVS